MNKNWTSAFIARTLDNKLLAIQFLTTDLLDPKLQAPRALRPRPLPDPVLRARILTIDQFRDRRFERMTAEHQRPADEPATHWFPADPLRHQSRVRTMSMGHRRNVRESIANLTSRLEAFSTTSLFGLNRKTTRLKMMNYAYYRVCFEEST